MANFLVHSVQQKSISLKFSKSRSGSHVTYSCRHNSSRFAFPIFVHSRHFSVFRSSINPEVGGGRIPLQDKYCHKSEPHWDYVEWGEKDNAGNLACPPSQK